MPPKKRKASQSVDGEEPSQSSTSAPSKRRKAKNAPNYDPQEICQELYEAIRTHRTDDGRVLCEAFIRAPKRRNEPDYYNTVTVPIDLLKIHNKIKSEEYDDVEQMTGDVELMLNNAKGYYKNTSQEYIDACELWELYTETKSVLLAEAFGEEQDNAERAEALTETESETAPVDDVDDDATDEYVEEGVEEIDEITQAEGEAQAEREEAMHVTGDTPPEELPPPTPEQPTTGKEVKTVPPVAEPPKAEVVPTVVPTVVPEVSEGPPSSVTEAPPVSVEPPSEAPGSEPKEEVPETPNSEEDTPIAEKEGHPEESEGEEKGGGDLEERMEELFEAIVTAKDGGRDMAEMFKVLPSREKYPDYYEIIKEPVDLKTIAKKILDSEYQSLESLVRDLNLMVHNAKTFNEPGSQIYRDSVTLRKLVHNKKTDLEQARPARPVRSERIRSRRGGGGLKLIQQVATLEMEEVEEIPSLPETPSQAEEPDEPEEGSTLSREDDPQWILFNTVRQWKNSLGQSLAEPFLKLPSRRIYPDYYEEIKKPMSLLKIKKKLKNGAYNTLDRLEKDFDLVFENAKHYNVDESKLYKDAVKLQTIMRAKKRELAGGKEELVEGPSPLGHSKARRSLDTNSQASDDDKVKKRFGGRKSFSPEEVLKKRLNTLYKAIYDFQVDGRHLIDIFITLPSKKDYPDYYLVISEPIDMTIIEEKIKNAKYTSQDGAIADFELMFNNARHYNEENSQVYKDADVLEKVLLSKARSLPTLDGSPSFSKSVSRSKHKTKSTTTLAAKLADMHNTIRDHVDPRGRTLSTPFMKLPLKSEYPDYFEIIKKPVDVQKIYQNMVATKYTAVEDMVSDFVLMFDNACKYNEPDSLIYKDALTLQRVCLEKKSELCADEDGNEVPDVRAAVQELMTNLFIATFNHADEEGRCYSDSFLELPSKIPADEDEEGKEEGEKQMKPAPCFEQVKRNIDKGRYMRLDRFQEDMFEVFEYARKASRTDSQVYEDSVELQMYFMTKRDVLCKNGEILVTPALSYTDTHLNKVIPALDAERKEKMTKEQREEEEKKKNAGEEDMEVDKTREPTPGGEDSFDYEQQTYHIGDSVYIEPREKDMDSHIVCIEKFSKDSNGEQKLHGCWFLRPGETYHVATRKFLQKEVFKSDFNDSVPFSKVLGKCYIMFVKDYFKMKPEGANEKDVYVCESRYSGRHKSFKKIKSTNWTRNEHVKLVERDVPLVPTRVASVFADKPAGEESSLLDDNTQILDKDREEVVIENQPGAEEGCIYYEQCQTANCWIKLGDSVYVKSEASPKPRIARIDKLWTDQNGMTYFHGPYFVPPTDVEHPPTRLFYKRELFRSSLEDTTPISNILGRCSVLAYKEYCSQRMTEVLEQDTFICESKYLEAEKAIKKFNKPMKKHTLTIQVCDDEVYFFKKPIIPNKEPSPLLMRVAEPGVVDYMDESSNMDSTQADSASLGGDFPAPSTPATDTPTEKRKKQPNKGKARNISGYIVFAAEYRKEVASDNPDLSFGEISKIVGAKWKSLPREIKDHYEAKAKKLCEDQAAKQAEADKAFNDSLNMFPPAPSPGGDRSMSPGGTNRPMTPGTAFQQGYQQGFQGQFSNQQGVNQGMMQHGMSYLPQNQHQGMPPPHGMPLGGMFGSPHHPQAGMTPQSRGTPLPGQNPLQGMTPQGPLPGQTSSQNTPQMAPPGPPPKPPSPMFVSVPPRTQRLLHSDAYLRYIEGLNPENKSVGDWERSLTATQETIPLQNTGKLPIHWLANGVGHHDNAVNALWALRDLMMKDTLTISRTLEFNQL